MARNRSFIPYDEPDQPYDQGFVGAYDEESGDPEFMAYGSAPPMAAEEYPLPEDPMHPEDALLPMPLFLADNGQELRRRGFGTGRHQNLNLARGAVWPRIFKAGMVAASAAAIAFGILSVGNPLALFADVKALLPGAVADQSGAVQNVNPQPSAAAPSTAAQLASVGPPTAVVPSTAAVRVSTPNAGVTPTRDDIALALKAAQQSQVQAPQSQVLADQSPAAPAPAPPPIPVRRLAADELATLLKRAKGLIAIGDIAPARLLLERAAEAQEPSAALLLAQTYDPAVLGTQDMRSITPDPAKARDWYQEAARLGSMDARQRLAEMQN